MASTVRRMAPSYQRTRAVVRYTGRGMRVAGVLLLAGLLFAGPPKPESACIRARGPMSSEAYPTTGRADLDKFIKAEQVVAARSR